MPYKFAVLWELTKNAQPVGLIIERGDYVLVELPNGYGLPKKYVHPYRVMGPDMSEIVYEVGAAGYFEQVLVELARHFAIVERGEVEESSNGIVLKLLQHFVLEPRTQRRRAEYPSGVEQGGARRPAPAHRRSGTVPSRPVVCGIHESHDMQLVA